MPTLPLQVQLMSFSFMKCRQTEFYGPLEAKCVLNRLFKRGKKIKSAGQTEWKFNEEKERIKKARGID